MRNRVTLNNAACGPANIILERTLNPNYITGDIEVVEPIDDEARAAFSWEFRHYASPGLREDIERKRITFNGT